MEPCYTCRRRHIRCDRTQTPCLKCQKAGLECVDKRPVRWVQGVAIRGGMRGRSYENDSVSLAPVQTSLARAPSASQAPNLAGGHPLAGSGSFTTWPALATPSIPSPVLDASLHRLSSAYRYYLDYYNERICSLFIVCDSGTNPFRSLIAMAMTDKPLLDAALALAARHRANSDRPFSIDGPSAYVPMDTNQDALRFKYRAIQGLSKSVSQGSYRDVTVATIFLFVFLDLLESGCDRWNFHLEGAKSLMTLKPPNDPGQTVQRIREFITKQVHLIEALGATFVRPGLLSQSKSVDESASLVQDVVEQSFLGCPGYILKAVQVFSRQRDSIISERSGSPRPENTITVLGAVKTFDCSSWASELPRESATHDVNDLCKLGQTYQLGAVLYGQRVVDAMNQAQTNQDPVKSELIQIIDSLQGSGLLKCTLWPITVAGLECRDQSQRALLMKALDQFWHDTKCFNVINAAKILQDYWAKTNDNKTVASDWIFEIGRSNHDWLLI